jgi:hypothetical protein
MSYQPNKRHALPGAHRERCAPMKQNRGAALLMVILILVIMTLMLFFNARVTSFESVISGNDKRAKLALHAAEAGISHAMRYLTHNLKEISRAEGDGWLSPAGANPHWLLCGADDTELPCSAAPLEADGRAGGFNRENVFYYVEDPIAESLNTHLPLGALITEYSITEPSVAIDQTSYQVQALLCVLQFDQDKYVSGDVGTYPKCDPSGAPDGISVAVKLIATGIADDGSSEAVITQTVASVEPGGGPPVVPIMSFNAVAPNGNLNVVANPNAGGVGVPASIWSRNYVSVEESGAGSIATCEVEEYLNTRASSFWTPWTDIDGEQFFTCDSCTCPDKQSAGALSHTQSTEPARKYFDIVDQAPDYPDDIFEYYFGVARTQHHLVRDAADQIIADCNSVDSATAGLVWVDGYCDLSGKVAGSATGPIALVATGGVKLNSNSIFYGVLLITDPTTPAELQAQDSIPTSLTGGPVIYGALLTDPGATVFNGGFTVVYLGDVLNRLDPLIVLGNLSGSWSDQFTVN